LLASAAEAGDRPFVETSIARLFASRLSLTHMERGISVISGPWGIGKTTALDAFVAAQEFQAVVVKVDPGSSKRGATPIAVMQLVIEAMHEMTERRNVRGTLSNAYWSLRKMIFDEFVDVIGTDQMEWEHHRFTIIFDEAQYLSRDAIEMLRFWNDGDRTTTPIPIGLVFVGNNEFALQEDNSGQSVLSGAVRSRALFIDCLEYADISDSDLILFLQSRGIDDAAAIAATVTYFSQPRVRRDFRQVERFVGIFKRKAGDGAVTAKIVRDVLSP
jgi:hypothetical protein